jgi:hypothetical protein
LSKKSRPHRECWPARPDLRKRWPSRLVATAAEDRLNIQPRNPRNGAQLDLVGA